MPGDRRLRGGGARRREPHDGVRVACTIPNGRGGCMTDKMCIRDRPIDLDIRYEDEHLIVLSKQAGLVCHPSVDHDDGTLVNALIYHCGADNLCNVQGQDDRLGIVHRLDRDTTGLMLAAKDDVTGSALMADIRDRAVDRRYLALVQGVIAHDTGMIDAPIARSASERTRMAVRDAPSALSLIHISSTNWLHASRAW